MMRTLAVILAATLLAACSSSNNFEPREQRASRNAPEYVIGAGDRLQINVRDNEDLSVTLPVRPDGRISVPMVRDVQAAGRTTSELADELEDELDEFIREPIVTVMVTDFVGTYADRIRVIGQAAEPQAIAYREGMTVLDAVIQVGGLTEFAAGNQAKLIRGSGDDARRIPVRLDDLVNDGAIGENRTLRPGDVLVIPESFF